MSADKCACCNAPVGSDASTAGFVRLDYRGSTVEGPYSICPACAAPVEIDPDRLSDALAKKAMN